MTFWAVAKTTRFSALSFNPQVSNQTEALNVILIRGAQPQMPQPHGGASMGSKTAEGEKENSIASMRDEEVVWVFNGGGSFPSGVFTSIEVAEAWIGANRLTGALTAYPLNTGIYDWAVTRGYFTPKRENQRSPGFIGRFSSGALEHHHYEDGISPRGPGKRPEETQ